MFVRTWVSWFWKQSSVFYVQLTYYFYQDTESCVENKFYVSSETPANDWGKSLRLSGLDCYCNTLFNTNQASVVEKVDRAIHWINLCLLGNAIGFPKTYSLGIQRLNNWDQVNLKFILYTEM